MFLFNVSFKYMTKNLNTSNLGVYVGRNSTSEISSRPYLTNDLALRPCFRIFIGLTYISLCSPTRYAHTRAMHTIATRRAIRPLSRRCVSSMLKPEDFMARNAVSISQRFFIGRYSIFRSVETDQNLKFRYPVRVLDSTSGEIDILPFMQKELVVEFLLSDFKRIEEPPHSDSFSCGGLDNPNILPGTDIVSNPVVVKPSYPLLADKLAVGHKAVYAIMSKKSDEPFHDSLAFLPIGIASFVQKVEQQWKGNAFVSDAKGEYIDVELSELPVGAVHTQNQTILNRKQRKDHPCYQIKVQGIVGDESLNATHIGITLNRRRHCRSSL